MTCRCNIQMLEFLDIKLRRTLETRTVLRVLGVQTQGCLRYTMVTPKKEQWLLRVKKCLGPP